MIFEITAETIEEARLAEKYGAKRVELCSALDLGGITPSIGLIQNTQEVLSNTELHALIRPRPGNFIYSKDEIHIMLSDIQTISELGAKGVVFGILKNDMTLDEELTGLLVEFAKKSGLEVTFHRAIDVCTNLEQAVYALIKMGVGRILTSGQSEKAIGGIDTLKRMIQWSDGKIQIMAGSGVNAENAKELINIGVDALHLSVRAKSIENKLQMGCDYIVDEEKLKSLIQEIN